MPWRGLHISNPTRLRLKDNAVIAEQDGAAHRFALEDLSWIVLDTPQASLTANMLSECAERGVLVIFTNAKHMPNGTLLPFHCNFRQAAVTGLQIALSPKMRDTLWQGIIRRKIENQAAHIESRNSAVAANLLRLACDVGPGDPANLEARAARAYWSALFDDFRRHGEHRRNRLLDYGYAILRAAMARHLASHGFIPALGIHHAAERNAFNLADDLIEPFRVYVDAKAASVIDDNAEDGRCQLSVADRRYMASILADPVALDHGTMVITNAIEELVRSLVRVVETGTGDGLSLPVWVPSARAA